MFSTGKGNEQPSWFGSPNECDWTGITCNSDNTVIKLQLVSKQLNGTIPDDVGLWTSLAVFSVSVNFLTGALPTTIGYWTDLTYFGVYFNQLDGTVPKEVSKWTSIVDAFFMDNKFSGIMPAFTNYCPATTQVGYLGADCTEIRCDCCRCCEKCF
jgi:hypothetical protein